MFFIFPHSVFQRSTDVVSLFSLWVSLSLLSGAGDFLFLELSDYSIFLIYPFLPFLETTWQSGRVENFTGESLQDTVVMSSIIALIPISPIKFSTCRHYLLLGLWKCIFALLVVNVQHRSGLKVINKCAVSGAPNDGFLSDPLKRYFRSAFKAL